MAMPRFTAETSVYRTTRSYRTSHHGTVSSFTGSGSLEVAPQLAFACLPDNSACACSGFQDCIDCVNSGHCTGHCECDINGTCVCG